jgi:hypothetical protein
MWRRITQLRRTPIAMLSGSDCESEAWGVGVDAWSFLYGPLSRWAIRFVSNRETSIDLSLFTLISFVVDGNNGTMN